jgi:V8-like Glu-specific endopeptidase
VRRQGSKCRWGIAPSRLLLAVLVLAATSAASAQASGIPVPASAARQARGFWTPARMRSARPVEITGPGASPAAANPRPKAGTAPHRVAAGAAPADPAPGSNFGAVADPTAPVLRQNGVIFFQAGLFGLGRCSGTAVSSPNRSVVFTAGHCVHSEGGRRGHWYRESWVFVPGYRYGQRPFGAFPAKWLDTTRGWLATGTENEDVAAAVVMPNERGERLEDVVGGAGIAWGLQANQVFDVHGYPVGPPFDGETQRLCSQTPFLGHDPASVFGRGPFNLAVGCEVTGGASGGGWTIHGDVLNGVTDYGYTEDPGTDYGAYFGREVGRLYKRVARVR